jgi:hypothetical protein
MLCHSIIQTTIINFRMLPWPPERDVRQGHPDDRGTAAAASIIDSNSPPPDGAEHDRNDARLHRILATVEPIYAA